MPNNVSNTDSQVYQGMSQQSPNLRIPGQCQDAVNCTMTVSRGLEKRAGSSVINSSATSFSNNSKIHRIDRDLTERYIMIVEDKKVRVLDTEGVEYVVEGANIDYLASSDPVRDFSMSTVADYTIIANRQIQSMLTANKTAQQNQIAYLWYKQDTSTFASQAIVEGVTFSGGAVGNQDVVAAASTIASNINGDANYTATHIAGTGVVKVVKVDGSDFTSIEASSTGGDQFATTFISDGGLKENIPPVGVDGDVIRIKARENSDTAYYLKYEANGRRWVESVAPESQVEFDTSTMPHQITREPDGGGGIKFVVAEASWIDRKVGDEDSVPPRSILTFPIEDVFFFKGRLGFIAGDSITMSVTKDYFNLYPTSATEVLDDDPIDITVSSNSVVTLLHATPFPDALMAFGQTQQFSIHSGTRAFTPANVIADEATSYNVDPVADPGKIGNSVFFSVPKQKYSSLRELMIEDDTLLKVAPDVSAHVPRFIPKEIQQIVTSESSDQVFLISENNSEMIAYKYYWQGNNLAQSSWSKWDFKDDWFTPVGAASFDDVLYLVGNDSEGSIVMSIPLENLTDEGNDYHLDRQIKRSNVFNDGDIKVVMDSNALALLYLNSGAYLIDSNDERRYVATSVNGDELTVVCDDDPTVVPSGIPGASNPAANDDRFTLGLPLEFLYELTEWNFKTEGQYIGAADVFLSQLSLDCELTGDLEVESIPFRRSTGYTAKARTEFGTVLGSWNGTEYSQEKGKFEFLVKAQAENLRTFIRGSNELPIRITAITRNGEIIHRRQSI